MKKDEFIQQIQAIGTCENEADRRTMLSELQEHVTADYDQLETLTNSNKQLTDDNENLRKSNLQLFLKIGSKNKPEETGLETEPEKDLKYENLFDENGGLK